MFKVWLFILITISFLASTLRLTEEWTSLITVLYVSLALILLPLIFYKKVQIKYNKFALTLMYLFLVFGIIAALINGDMRTLFRVSIFFLLYISIGLVIPSYFRDDTGKLIAVSIALSHVPILLIPVLMDAGVEYTPYAGMFVNPNNFGVVSVSLFAVFASFLFKDIENLFFYRKIKINAFTIFNLVAVAVLLLLISYSASRTSFLTALAIVLTGISLVIAKLIQHKKLGNLLLKGLFISPLVVVTILILNTYVPIGQSIDENILSKFERKSVNVLDGRDVIWQQTVNEAGFFGGGSDFFYGNISLGSHNTFVTILGTYGWVPFIAIVLFFILASYHILKQFMNSDSKYKYVTPIMLIAFLVLSMAEDMHYKLSMVAILALAGYCMNSQKLLIKNSF